MKKKIVAIGISAIIAANMCAPTALQIFAEEGRGKIPPVTEGIESDIVGLSDSEIEDLEEQQTAERNLTAIVNIENEKYGTIKGLDKNPIVLNTQYKNVEEKSKTVLRNTYTWLEGEVDEDKSSKPVNIEITPKSGYEWSFNRLETLSQNISSDNASITIKPLSLIYINLGIIKYTQIQDNKNIDLNIKFDPKKDAQTLRTITEGKGKIEPTEDNLYFEGTEENNVKKALIDNKSEHTFLITPEDGYKIGTVKHNNEVKIPTDNKVTVGTGELVVNFVEDDNQEVNKFDLDINITGQGTINIDNQSISQSTSIKLNKQDNLFSLVPGLEQHVSSVKLNGNYITPNNGIYIIPGNQDSLDNQNLEIVFAEKIETEIRVTPENLRVAYTGNEQYLEYKVVEKNNKNIVVDAGKATFKKKNMWNQDVVYKPKDIGIHKFEISFGGNDKHKSSSLSGEFEIYDARKIAEIKLSGTSKVYNGQKQNVEAVAYDPETNEPIENASVSIKFDNISLEDFLAGKVAGKDVGTYKFTATYEGDKKYQKTEVRGTLEIKKCTPKVTVQNKKAEYTGQEIKTNVTVNPKCGYINIYTGLNTNLNAKAHIEVELGDGIAASAIEGILNSIKIQNIGQLKDVLINNKALLAGIGVDISDIINALNYIPDNLSIGFGSPVDAGGYLSTAIVLDQNANVAVGVGSLLITRQSKDVVFTEGSLANGAFIKPGTTYKHEAKYKDTEKNTKIMYSGIAFDGETYLSLVPPQKQGTYVALAYATDDPEYKVALAARGFTIVKDLSLTKITSNNEVVYNGQPYSPSVEVKDSKGNIIEDATVEYTYYQGKEKLDFVPTEVGKYTVIATYHNNSQYLRSDAMMNFQITKAALAVKADNIEKTQGEEDPKLTYTTYGLANSDDIKFNLYREQGETVGTYAIKIEEKKLNNYNMVPIEGVFTINPINTSIINQVPRISGADDVTIKVGSSFDKLAGVKAYDKEEGDITSRIEVTGEVDTAKEDKYVLTYSVEDKQGASKTVIRNVTVEKIPTSGGGSTGGGSVTIPPKPELSDINNHWANKEIQYFVEKRYIDGYGDKTFRPEGLMTRAEFVKLVNKVFNLKDKGSQNFKDVSSNDWFYENVCIAVKAGYIDGYGDGTFKPNAYISREEASKIIAKLTNLKGDGKIDFKDKENISSWAKEHVDALSDNKIINGYAEDNTFRPQNKIKRAEAVVMLFRLNK